MPDPKPEIILEDPPDPMERNLRIGCGSVVGLVVALCLAFRFLPSLAGFLVTALLAVVACAWLALRYGDAFFESMLKWMQGPWM